MNPARVKRRCVELSAALAFFLFAGASPSKATIRYRISLADTDAHRFQVTMLIPTPPREETTVAMPAWNALYEIRDFAYRVRDVKAAAVNDTGNESTEVPVVALDKETWRIVGDSRSSSTQGRQASACQVTYSIQWNEPGPFSSQLNEHHAFLNLAEVLMYVPSGQAEPVEIQFDKMPAGWKLAAELPTGPDPNSFTAANYDALVDAPVEAGTFEEFDFDNAGARFRIVVDAKSFNRSRLEEYLRRITSYEIQLMSGAPFKEYMFVFHFGQGGEIGGGGMEHANAAAISASSVDAPDLFAHEFFHAWNVKRIRPQTLEPADYAKEQYTRALWFAEGVTSTYGAYTMVRTGLWSKDGLYDELSSQINELESRPARKWESAEASSLDAWLEKYDEYNSPDRSISYYNKGEILGFLLDIAIRDATDDRKSLDDVMRRMNDEYAKAGKSYADSAGIRSVVEEVAGKSFEDFFRRYVAGVDGIPYRDFLADAGLELKAGDVKAVDLGFTPGRGTGQGVPVNEVEGGSSAEAAGLRAGDVIVQRNGQEVPRGRRAWARDVHPGDTLNLVVLRDGRTLNVSYVLAVSEQARYTVVEMAHPTEKQRRIRDGLLRGTTD